MFILPFKYLKKFLNSTIIYIIYTFVIDAFHNFSCFITMLHHEYALFFIFVHIWNALILHYCSDYSFKSLSLGVSSAYCICWFYFSVLAFLKMLIILDFGLIFCGRILESETEDCCGASYLLSTFRYFLQLLINRELFFWLNMIINLSIKNIDFYKFWSEIHNCV